MVTLPRNIALGLLKPINPFTPFLLGVYTLLWGLWLISPFWLTFGSARLFHFMGGFAPEWAWGIWSVVAGISVCVHTAKQNFCGMSRSLGFLFWHWFTVAWLLWIGDWQNTAGLTYSTIAAYSAYLFLNVRINFYGKVSNWHIVERLRRKV